MKPCRGAGHSPDHTLSFGSHEKFSIIWAGACLFKFLKGIYYKGVGSWTLFLLPVDLILFYTLAKGTHSFVPAGWLAIFRRHASAADINTDPLHGRKFSSGISWS